MTHHGKAIVRDSQVDDPLGRSENPSMARGNSRPNPGAPLIHNRARWARRAAFVTLAVALCLDIAAVIVGLSRDGAWGWAIHMPIIVPLAVTGGAVSVVGAIAAIVRLIKQTPTDIAVCFTLAGLIVTGLASGLIALVAFAASASV